MVVASIRDSLTGYTEFISHRFACSDIKSCNSWLCASFSSMSNPLSFESSSRRNIVLHILSSRGTEGEMQGYSSHRTDITRTNLCSCPYQTIWCSSSIIPSFTSIITATIEIQSAASLTHSCRSVH
jgi:hypothetical protein